MAIDLRKNKDSLLKAYNEVVADNNDIDWAVFAYEGQTAVLKLAETGEGGISEMVDELNSSKIMYAFCKVMDPNTNLPKYVLISWQGEAAPESMKFKCANHLRDVTHFFRGVHVTINARTEDDLDEDDILKKVSKSSGSQYSIHHEKAKPQEPVAPVGSVYQKTQAARDINMKRRDQFWAQTEAKEQELRDQQVQERMRAISQQKAAERRASQTDDEASKKQWEKEQEQAIRDEEERRKAGEHARKERAAEAERLAASQTSSARNFFKRKESHSEDHEPIHKAPPSGPGKLKHNFGGSVDQSEAPTRKAPIQLPRDQPSPPPNQPARQPSPPPKREPSPPPREPSPPPRQPSPPPQRQPSPPPQRQPSPPPKREPSPPSIPTQQPQTRNLLAGSLPPRQADSDEEENEDEDWGEDENANDIPAVHAQHIPDEPIEEPVSPQQPTQQNTGGDKGVCAQALYDYQAADDTEITFDPDDIITQIEQIDEGWWVGNAPDGSRGMFPANYVEVFES
ncbi:drebrin-like protein B isoform X2 [Ruditapes philippinarum]|uniref:drebrin-like protein B isoform X2 n=1 Tax=Ruditapes philippinarum TaxID=129788 RepID=UPI00295B0CF4|nr:drebrin-like protein B isoform X2 [Ruditapes philippinarum]